MSGPLSGKMFTFLEGLAVRLLSLCCFIYSLFTCVSAPVSLCVCVSVRACLICCPRRRKYFIGLTVARAWNHLKKNKPPKHPLC